VVLEGVNQTESDEAVAVVFEGTGAEIKRDSGESRTWHASGREVLFMERQNEAEILDGEGVPDDQATRAYGQLARLHRLTGDTALVVRAIRGDALPVRRILDIGCASGLVAEEVHRKLRVEVVGIDLNPRESLAVRVPIVRADAVRDPLPGADVAFSMYLGHHLTESELATLIRNVGRYCRRFILIDLVRHPLPLALFRLFVEPFASRIVVEDGKTSFRRSYTVGELYQIAASALAGSVATFRQSVGPFYLRQVINISYHSQTITTCRLATTMRRSVPLG
jgi:SAM-dependent methyltransferase